MSEHDFKHLSWDEAKAKVKPLAPLVFALIDSPRARMGYDPDFLLEEAGYGPGEVIITGELRRELMKLAALLSELERWQKAVKHVEQDPPKSEGEGEFPGYREGWLDAIHNIYLNTNQEPTQ